MPEEKPDESKPLGGELIDGARRLADDADRWFVSLARNLGRGARWTKDEVGVIADAAVAAGRTTGSVTRKVFSRLRSKKSVAERPAELAAELDGVLHALGALVAELGPEQYPALASQDRFWKLLQRARALRDEIAVAVREKEEAERAAAEEAAAAQQEEPVAAREAAAETPAEKKPAASADTKPPERPDAHVPRPPKQAANVISIRPGSTETADASDNSQRRASLGGMPPPPPPPSPPAADASEAGEGGDPPTGSGTESKPGAGDSNVD